MKTKQGGYKAMLRDRVPKTTDLALKWLKLKNKWVDHVYYNFIWFCKDRKLRDAQTRALLGLGKYGYAFYFNNTINWDNCDEEERKQWKKALDWVKWFENNWINIENTIDINQTVGKSEEETKAELADRFYKNLEPDWQEKLANYLLKNHNNEYLCIFQTLV